VDRDARAEGAGRHTPIVATQQHSGKTQRERASTVAVVVAVLLGAGATASPAVVVVIPGDPCALPCRDIS